MLAWIRAERPRLAGAALTILRAYCLAGRPDQRVRPWGSFEAWSDLVRAAVVWCGLPDPGDARIGLPDTARDLTAQLIAGWHEAFPAGTAATVAAAVDLVTRHEHQDRYGGLRAALIDIAGRPLDRVDLVSLGKRLDRFRDRVAGGFTFQKLPRGERGVPWRVVEVSMPAAVGPADAEGEPAPRVNGGEGKLVTGGTTTSTVGTVSPRLAPWQRGES